MGLSQAIPTRRGTGGIVSSDPTVGQTEDHGSASKPTNDPPEELSTDETFDILRNSRRRAVLTCLRANGGEMSVEALSECVAADEYDVQREAVTTEQYRRIYTGLYQCHLCRMEELGVLDFDNEDNMVRLRRRSTHLEPYLDPNRLEKWARFEFLLASGVASVVILGLLGMGPFAAIPTVLYAGLTIATLVGLAVWQARTANTMPV